MKKELNDQFRLMHSDLHPSLTLSMIRNLKNKLLQVAIDRSLELCTVAKAYTYFEKLVLKGLVMKQNRKLVGGN